TTELAVEPNFQILRRHRRSLLLRLEHAHRSAVENHVHRPPRLGSRRSLNLRIGIRPARIDRAQPSGNYGDRQGDYWTGQRGRTRRREAVCLSIEADIKVSRPTRNAPWKGRTTLTRFVLLDPLNSKPRPRQERGFSLGRR